MDVYVTKLRKFLGDDPAVALKNIHGAGFQLVINS
jgi:DNA-binding response OmpR family regulator